MASVSAPSWLCVVLIFFIPESPRWLLNNGDFEALHRQLEVMARWNGADLSVLRGNLIRPQAVEENKKGSITELFRPQHIRTTMQVLVASFCATLAYFGVALFQVSCVCGRAHIYIASLSLSVCMVIEADLFSQERRRSHVGLV